MNLENVATNVVNENSERLTIPLLMNFIIAHLVINKKAYLYLLLGDKDGKRSDPFLDIINNENLLNVFLWPAILSLLSYLFFKHLRLLNNRLDRYFEYAEKERIKRQELGSDIDGFINLLNQLVYKIGEGGERIEKERGAAERSLRANIQELSEATDSISPYNYSWSDFQKVQVIVNRMKAIPQHIERAGKINASYFNQSFEIKRDSTEKQAEQVQKIINGMGTY